MVWLWAKNEYGCIDSQPEAVHILPDVMVFVPNAFNPKSKLVNTEVDPDRPSKLFWAQASGIATFQIQIYSRWGELMYESNDWVNHGWNGTYLNSTVDAPMGAYVWIIRVKGMDGIDYKYTGTVTLLR
jgi:hypothetical protein